MRAVLGRLGLMPLAKPLTSKEGHGILERDRYRCQYCGLDGMANFENSLVMSVDFVLPRSQKGSKKPENLVASCRACNARKEDRLPAEAGFRLHRQPREPHANLWVIATAGSIDPAWEPYLPAVGF